MSKKIIYIILIIVIGLLIIGSLIWYFILRTETTLPPNEEAEFTVPGETDQEKIRAVSDGSVISANLSGDEILFYDYSGQLWQPIANNSKPVSIAQSPVRNIAEIIWSQNLKHIIKIGTDQSDINYLFSDPEKKTLINLKNNIKSLAFSPDAKKIIYQILDLKTNSLLISDPNGKNQKTLISALKFQDIVLYWPKTNQIALTSKPSGLMTGSSWLLDTRSLNFTKTISDLFGLETLYSPDGNNFIYSYVDQNGRNPKLAIYNKGILKNIDNISTLVDKCAWVKDSLSVFCAVPKFWPDYMILPDDYYKRNGLTSDEIWKINIETGEKNLISPNLGSVNNIIASKDKNSLYFILRNNQYLYKLNLN